MFTALYNLHLVTDGSIATGKAIIIKDHQISAVVDEKLIPGEAMKRNMQGAYVAPGLIDLQIYGSGAKFFGGKPEIDALRMMEDDLLSRGTTGFFACIATNNDAVVEQGITVAKAYRAQARGNFWGLHLEGPYLNAKRKGAHPAEYIKKATLEEVQRWVEMANGTIKMITIAPELQDREVIEYLNSRHIILSSGHSDATYEQAKAFINRPIHAITHLFNAMPQMHHREPGIIPAIFEERPYTSIVADGIHVSYPMIRLAKRELGDKLFFITDAVTTATEGNYQHRFTGDRYVMPDGTLSGSCLTMLKAVKNGVKHAGIDLAEAINMASLYPAQLARKLNKGRIAAGYDADLIIFNNGFEVLGTYLMGQPVVTTDTILKL
jgi:N-acetylglucosamine-6-phosphate deacetylase